MTHRSNDRANGASGSGAAIDCRFHSASGQSSAFKMNIHTLSVIVRHRRHDLENGLSTKQANREKRLTAYLHLRTVNS